MSRSWHNSVGLIGDVQFLWQPGPAVGLSEDVGAASSATKVRSWLETEAFNRGFACPSSLAGKPFSNFLVCGLCTLKG